MKITDKEALKELKRCNSEDLYEQISTYPEDEREGRSDMEVFADELSYRLSLYDEDTLTREDLICAREILWETKNGKYIPLRMDTLRPKYRESDITIAKDCVNEYRRLKSCMKRTNEKGYYGSW